MWTPRPDAANMIAAMADASVFPSPASISDYRAVQQQRGGGQLLPGWRVQQAVVIIRLEQGAVEVGREVYERRMFGGVSGRGL